MRQTNNFDGLRLIGALLVLCSHQFALAGHPEPQFLPGRFATFGALGVYIFFAISGYLVCQSWRADPNAHRFIERRFLRIWPGMAVAIVLTGIVVTIATGAEWVKLASYLRNLVCLRCDEGLFFPAHPHQNLYGSMWTIPLEVYCYGLLLAAGMLARTRLPLLVTVIAGFVLASPFINSVELSLMNLRWPVGYHGAFFLAGCVIAFNPQLIKRAWLPILGGVALLMRDKDQAAILFILAPAVIWVGLQSWPVLRSAGRWGDLSYGIYLYAWAVQQLGVFWLGNTTSVWILMAISVAASTALAFASWHLVEKRALRLKPQRERSSEAKAHRGTVVNAVDDPVVDDRAPDKALAHFPADVASIEAANLHTNR